MSSPSEHASFSPSAADRWLVCPAAVPLERIVRAASDQVDDSTPYTRVGVWAHGLGEKWIRQGITPLESDAEFIATGSEEPIDEFIAAAEVYAEDVMNRAAELDVGTSAMQGGADLLVEERITVVGKDCWGTADAALAQAFGVLEIIDFKSGSRHVVDPENNVQLMTYAAGLLAKYKKAGIEIDSVRLTIVQPRAEGHAPVRSWDTEPEWIERHLKRVKKAIKASALTGAERNGVPGEHCRWCKGQSICPAKRTQALACLDSLPAGDGAPAPLVERVASISPPALAEIWRKADRIRAFLDAVDAQCLIAPPPGLKVVTGAPGKAVWNKDDLMVEAGLVALGIEPHRKMLITIGDARAAAGKANLEKVNALTVKAPGKPTVVEESDPRPAIGASAVAALT